MVLWIWSSRALPRTVPSTVTGISPGGDQMSGLPLQWMSTSAGTSPSPAGPNGPGEPKRESHVAAAKEVLAGRCSDRGAHCRSRRRSACVCHYRPTRAGLHSGRRFCVHR
ncbi:hypothetical protein ACFFX0_22655 [Citricoccus parietis]|uniref:Secreted protein n=1 Tax=Citricoccus parietis TaxID=592307 RepID=A0ABV5G4I5_9MICC